MNYIDNWSEEKQAAYLYAAMAKVESGHAKEKLFLSLAKAAERQADIWAEKVRALNPSAQFEFRPSVRAKLIAMILPIVGPKALKPALAAMKVRGLSIYSPSEPGHEMPTSRFMFERKHQTTKSGGNLRAAVFGLNDGLVSNASLILGVAGATADPHTIVLTGVAGLLAGAFSMASGEYISVRSQKELLEYQIGLEKEEIENYPEEEEKELALIYEAKGLASQEARVLAAKILSDPVKALDTLAREELGLNPDELGSPWWAALSSFLSFGAGAFIPLLPFLFFHSHSTLHISILFTACSLFVVGATLSLFTGRSAIWGGLRMLSIGLAAGGATYFIGKWVGVSLG